MIGRKTVKDIELMAPGGKILWKILLKLREGAQEGVTTQELDHEAERLIKEAGGEPSFKKVPKYRFATCLCVNEVIVHGLPSVYQLKKGDLLGVDVGMFYQGFHTDAAWTIMVGKPGVDDGLSEEKKKFLKIGEKALEKAIEATREGNHVGDISREIQETIEGAGYSVVRALVGHGIGRKLHEHPQIPGFLTRKVGKTPLLESGMTLAIEVIYNMGGPEVVYRNDGWTIATKDGYPSGLFEKTVAVTKDGPIVLTA